MSKYEFENTAENIQKAQEFADSGRTADLLNLVKCLCSQLDEMEAAHQKALSDNRKKQAKLDVVAEYGFKAEGANMGRFIAEQCQALFVKNMTPEASAQQMKHTIVEAINAHATALGETMRAKQK